MDSKFALAHNAKLWFLRKKARSAMVTVPLYVWFILFPHFTMDPLCKTGWGILCQHTETWIHSLDNLMDLLVFSKTTLPNSASTGAFLSWPAVSASPVIQTGHFLCLTYLFIGCLSPYSSWGKATQTRPRGREEYPSKTSLTPHYPFHPKKRGHKQEKKGHPTSWNQRSQQLFSGVEHRRLIQTCCWIQEQKGNARMSSNVYR